MMSDRPDIEHYRQLLRARYKSIMISDTANAAETGTVELDQTRVGRVSRMDAMQVQAMSVAAAGRRNEELARISAALERIAEGEFGFCMACGDEIPVARLEIDPAVTLCVACGSKREQND
jgi:DnaK suppressor protein